VVIPVSILIAFIMFIPIQINFKTDRYTVGKIKDNERLEL